jgi:hypothetical protein
MAEGRDTKEYKREEERIYTTETQSHRGRYERGIE